MRNLSFRTKTSIVASLVVGLIAMFGFGVFVYYTYNQQRETLIERVRYSGQIQTTALSQAMWDFNYAQVKLIVESFRKDPDFVGAAVYDENEKIIAKVGDISDGIHNITFSESIYRAQGAQSRPIGRLDMFVSSYKMGELINQLISLGALFIVIIILLLIFSIILTLRIATSTLNKVTGAMERYAEGDKSVEIPDVKSNDEIGRLAKTFKMMKQELDSLQHGLEQKVTERTSELQEAKKTAEQANDAKSRFISAVSHELRTPLSSIIGFSGMISQQVFGPIENPQYLEYLRNINESAEHLMKVINDLLDISKAEACRLELEKIEFNTRKVFDKTKAIFQISAMERGLELKMDIDSSVPAVLVGDPVRIKQILINIIGNAMKFTKQGGVTVSVKFDNETARMDIEITDTGMGIPEDKIGKLFQQFSQADVSTFRKFGGTGLGLAITKTLVELMQGEIKVESQVGVGTKFKFFLMLDKRVEKVVENNGASYSL